MDDALEMQEQDGGVTQESLEMAPSESTTSKETSQDSKGQLEPETKEPEKKEPTVLFTYGDDVITSDNVVEKLSKLFIEKTSHQGRADRLYRELQELKQQAGSGNATTPSGQPAPQPQAEKPMDSQQFIDGLLAGPGTPEFEKSRSVIAGQQPGITVEQLNAAVSLAVKNALEAQQQLTVQDNRTQMKYKFDTWQAQYHAKMINDKIPVPPDIQLAAQNIINANAANQTVEDYQDDYEKNVRWLMQKRGLIDPFKAAVKTSNQRTAAALAQQQIEGAGGTLNAANEEAAVKDITEKLGSAPDLDII